MIKRTFDWQSKVRFIINQIIKMFYHHMNNVLLMHVLFAYLLYLVSPSLVAVIFFIAQCNPIICMMIKKDNKVSVFCILH